jgi:hypothetical protein
VPPVAAAFAAAFAVLPFTLQVNVQRALANMEFRANQCAKVLITVPVGNRDDLACQTGMLLATLTWRKMEDDKHRDVDGFKKGIVMCVIPTASLGKGATTVLPHTHVISHLTLSR